MSATVLCGSAAFAAAEHAQSAAAFVDSIGMNVHLSYRDGPYGHFTTIEKLLLGLGVHHVRDGMVPNRPELCTEHRALARSGIRVTFITASHPTTDSLRAWVGCTGPALEAFEGPNEYDISHPPSDGDWAASLRESQRALFADVKGDAGLARFPVIGPSLTSEAAYGAVGDLSPFMDFGNVHNYFSGHEPGTPGWGLGGYGSIAYNVRIARIVDGAHPIESTETGYETTAARHGVDVGTQADYVPRLFLEQFKAGVVRTFEYELVDEGPPPFGNFGVVSGDLTPKPAYAALASLIALLRDERSCGTCGTLQFSLDGASPNVHHALFEKGDGRFYLALWLESAEIEPDAGRSIAVQPANVTVDVATPLRAATLYAYDAAYRLRPRALPRRGTLRVPVTARASVLELTPAQSVAR